MAQARLAVLFLLLLGCQPGIGDECATSTDCGAAGDRICDITQPSGYCTVFNCEPGTCPEDSTCVLFGATASAVPGCEDASGASPYQRSFCMATCGSDDDCRSRYACLDLASTDNPWGAVVIDRGSTRICIVPYSAAPLPDDRSSEVCTGTDEEFEPPPEPMSSAGGGGDGGGGEGGAPMSVSGAGAGGEGGAPMSVSSAGAGGS